MSVTHGLRATYTTGGCRCDDCTRANREYQRRYKARLKEEGREPPAHGTENAYNTYACRCDDCRAVMSARYYRLKEAK